MRIFYLFIAALIFILGCIQQGVQQSNETPAGTRDTIPPLISAEPFITNNRNPIISLQTNEPALCKASSTSRDFDEMEDALERINNAHLLYKSGLKDGDYKLYIICKDGSGNKNAPFLLTFTVDTTSPSLLSVYPTDGSSNIEKRPRITIVFDKNINRSSAVIALETGGTKVPGTISWKGSENTLFFMPSYELAANTQYTVTLAAKDIAGNPFRYAWKFKTG